MTRLVRLSILMALFLGAVLACGAETAISVVIAGQPLKATPPPALVSDVPCGPLEACAKLAGARACWDPDAGKLSLTSAEGHKVTLAVGTKTAVCDGRSLALRVAVEARNGVCFGPLEPVLQALGCSTHYKPGATRLTANGLLRSVEVRADAGGARINLRTSLPTSGRLGSDVGPPRRFIDLRGTEIPSQLLTTRYIYTGSLARVRFGELSEAGTSARVVADLIAELPGRWQPSEDALGGSLIIGSPSANPPIVERHLPRVTEITTSQPADGSERFRVRVNWPLKLDYDILSRPPRIRVSLPEVQAGLRDPSLPMYGEFVESVSVNEQHTPPATTLEVRLRELIQLRLEELPGGGGEVIFRRERLRDKTVVLDPGHGGKDTGARGRVLNEKDVNLDVANRTAYKLRQLGARALLTRTDDSSVPLEDRPNIARELGGDVFVSIHCNAMPRRNEGHGTESFYYFLESKPLGLILQDCLVQALQRADRGTKWARFYVIRKGEIPAALVELMFLNNDTEEALLQQETTRDRAAWAITEGIRQYIEGTGSLSERMGEGAGLRRLP